MAPDKKGKKKAAPAESSSAAAASIDDIFAAPKKTTLGANKAGKKRSADDDSAKSKKTRTEDKASTTKSAKDGRGDKKDIKKGDEKKKSGAKAEATRTVEEVVDPSVAVDAAVERAKEARAAPAKGKRRERQEVEEDRLWRDSRGDGDREFTCLLATSSHAGKRTEEGYFVFKEAELGIDPEAGGTPLCPFDCECCELHLAEEKTYVRLLVVQRLPFPCTMPICTRTPNPGGMSTISAISTGRARIT